MNQRHAAEPLEDPVSRDDMGPAAPGQEEIWLACALEREAPLFAISIVLSLAGKPNIPLLEQAISQVVRRHETLRTTYQPELDGLTQKVGRPYYARIALCDLSELDGQTRRAIGASVCREEGQAPFDLRNGPILRALLIKNAAEDFTLLFTVHHIAVDGWSMRVFARDLERIYTAYRRGGIPDPDELTLRYLDFARLQNNRLAARRSQGEIEELKRRFQVPPLVFTIERRCTSGARHEGEHVRLRFPAGLDEQLAAFGRQVKATRFAILTAVLWIVLYLYSRRTSFVMACDYANRDEPGSDCVIGLFVSQLLLRGTVDTDAPFKDVIRLAQHELQQARRLADCPLGFLLPEGAGRGGAAPFRVKLTCQPKIARPDLADVEVVAADILSDWAKFDLLFSVHVDDDLTSWELQYRKVMFHRSDMVAMLAVVEDVARLAIQRPQATVASLINEVAGVGQGSGGGGFSVLKKELLGCISPTAQTVGHDLMTLTESGRLTTAGAGGLSPLLLRALVPGLSLRYWIAVNKAFIEEKLRTHGAILFRDFHLDIGGFQAVCAELMGDLMTYVEGATPRQSRGAKIYSSTLFPQDERIELHNELSSAMTFPGKIAFYCVMPAQSGGETPLADVHQVYSHLPEPVRDQFAKRGWMLVRNFHKGFGLSWQQAFETREKHVVEDYCRNNEIEYAWEEDGNLRLRERRTAILTHPVTRLPVWFNHVAFWHESRLESGLRTMLLREFGRNGLPFNTYYGDGGRIASETVDVICSAYHRASVSFTWQCNDVLYVDNIATAHGRTAYRGPRDLLVAMGQPHLREKVS